MKSGRKPKYNIPEEETRSYSAFESCIFKKNNEKFGSLSNMSTKFPIRINDVKIRTVEALYQAMRFPSKSQIQLEIINEPSPMKVKMISQKYKFESRDDWESVRVKIMKWCLHLKYAQNVISFTDALRDTEKKYIVENSSSDNFWGAIPNEDQSIFTGKNALGRLLMDLRDKVNSSEWIDLLVVSPPPIENLKLYNLHIGTIDERVNFIHSLVSHWTQKDINFNLSELRNFDWRNSITQSNLGISFNKNQIDLF